MGLVVKERVLSPKRERTEAAGQLTRAAKSVLSSHKLKRWGEQSDSSACVQCPLNGVSIALLCRLQPVMRG